MKLFSAGKPVKRSTGMNCLLVNQFATPGLGSLMGGRIVAGAAQLTLAIVGFALFLVAMIAWFATMFNQFGTASGSSEVGGVPWYGKIGVILFVTSWLLSWITSISILREATKTERESLLAGKPPKLH